MNRFINESLNYVKQQEGLKLIEFITSYQLRKAQYVNMCPLLFSGNSNLLDSKESELKSEVLIKMLSFNNEKPGACKRRVIEQSEELTNVKASQQSKRNQLIKLFNIIPIKNELKYQDQANKNKEKDSGIFNQIDKHQKVEENIESNLIDKQNEGSSEIQLNQDDFIAYAQSEDQSRKSTIKQVQSQQDLDDNWDVERDSIRFSQFNRIASIGSNSKVDQKTVFRVSQQALILGKTRKIHDQPIQGHQQHTSGRLNQDREQNNDDSCNQNIQEQPIRCTAFLNCQQQTKFLHNLQDLELRQQILIKRVMNRFNPISQLVQQKSCSGTKKVLSKLEKISWQNLNLPKPCLSESKKFGYNFDIY